MSIISYHSLPTVKKTISDQIVFAMKIRLKGRILDVLGYIHHRLFFSVANSEWHFFPILFTWRHCYTLEGRWQRIENDRLCETLYVDKCFKVSNILLNYRWLIILLFLRANYLRGYN